MGETQMQFCMQNGFSRRNLDNKPIKLFPYANEKLQYK